MHTLTLGVRDSLAMIDRSVRGTLRQIDSLLMSIVLPVFMMLLFVHGFGGAMEVGTAYVKWCQACSVPDSGPRARRYPWSATWRKA